MRNLNSRPVLGHHGFGVKAVICTKVCRLWQNQLEDGQDCTAVGHQLQCSTEFGTDCHQVVELQSLWGMACSTLVNELPVLRHNTRLYMQ